MIPNGTKNLFWQRPMPTLGSRLSSAAIKSLIIALGLSILCVGAMAAWSLGNAKPEDQVGASALLSWGAQLAALLWVVGFLCALIASSRPVMDVVFTGAGFCATFFGLAMLVIFFYQLGVEVTHWFQQTPALVQKSNEFLISQVANVDAIMLSEKNKVLKEMEQEIAAAATEEEKKEVREIFEKDIIPGKIKDLEQTAKDAIRERDLGVRPDTSGLANFWFFLTNGPSNKPQDAGIFPALLGSLWLGAITILFAVPVGVGAALYLEEYKQKGWLGQLIQININNLAGVPSVVYGILGAFVFVEMIFKPLSDGFPDIAARNVVGGGLTLGLLTLPVVIVAAQEAIRAVPNSLRQGAYALGATRWQVMWHTVLPMARPGILTGTILSLSRAIGEAAPLVLFGALLFVNQNPSPWSRFTVLPMQIFGWADRPEEIWRYNAAMASLVLLVLLLSMNALAIVMRNRAQKKMRY